MAAKLKAFLFGLVVGAVIAFLLGMNYGRDEPLLSNPFADRSLSSKVKQKADEMVESAREKIHKATQPEKR
jgi:gas vesicle protein